MMKLSLLASLGLFAATARSSASLTFPNATTIACEALQVAFRSQVFYPGSANYTTENQAYWTPTDYLSPGCVFVPTSAIEVSIGVLILGGLQSPFAVRGGGHMPIPGYANTAGGVLIALDQFSQATLSADSSYVSVGPGLRWEDVYEYLEPYGLIALGGRVGNVGVPGLLLGGGISFYSNQYGFAADNVIAYQVVLANGQVVEATATAYSDLFWALKGGGNSFGIVTRFDIKTYQSPTVCAGILEVPITESEAFLSALANFGQYGSLDSKAAVIPSIFMLGPSLGDITVYTSALFYDGTECAQPALANFTALPAIQDTYGTTTLATYVKSTDALIGDGTRQVFRVVSSMATASALNIVNSTFIDQVYANIWNVTGIQASIAFQPVTKNFIQQGINSGGNPQNVDITDAPYFWMVINLSWTDSADDSQVNAFAVQLTNLIEQQLTSADQVAQFQYMNDAGSGQEIFQRYGPGSLAKLQSIRAKYDPFSIYTNVMSGGWKVATA